MIEGKQGKVWATITESPNNQPNSFEASRPVSFQAPHSTTAISVPVNISVDHSRSKIYRMSNDANIAPPEAMASGAPKPNTQFAAPQSFNAAEIAEAGASVSPNMDPNTQFA